MARSRAARVASPTIAEVLATFLADERRCLAPRTFAQYGRVVELFQHSLNGYAHQSLGKSDAKGGRGRRWRLLEAWNVYPD